MAILDKEKYMKYMEKFDMTHEQKVEYIETLWVFAQNFVAKQFGNHPIQHILEDREREKKKKEEEEQKKLKPRKHLSKRIIPEVGFVELDVILTVFPVSEEEWLEGVKSGDYPKPVSLSKKTKAWRAKDISELLKRYES